MKKRFVYKEPETELVEIALEKHFLDFSTNNSSVEKLDTDGDELDW